MTILENQRLFYKDRETMKEANSSFPFLLSRLYEEVEELKNAPTNHLGLKKHQEQELVDIILFALTALDSLMGDPEGAIKEKQSKNILKYQPYLFQSGIPFECGVAISRQLAFDNHLDEEFYA